MAKSVIGVVSQSSLLLIEPSKFGFRTYATPSTSLRLQQSSSEKGNYRFVVFSDKHLKPVVAASVVYSGLESSTLVTDDVDLSTEGIEIEPDSGSGGDGYRDIRERRRGRIVGGSGGEKKKMALSMSQKLSLGYAALVGMGGLMGYLKSGSQKSLLAGGLSASILYYVHTQLPTNPVYASSIGLGVSSILMGVMGSRFLRSKKIFPAGVVSLVSLVMAGGYIHGVLRSMH
ncbi:hypothetical protein GH714_028831 [Hevea brasiliensis]|uniref:Uncharacterized protein n=1 Tax=Hevea brasiliensis TaxID=3981 RepID=A0A6A6LVS0_HEVBR|nr:hypothetical protein GH714_028831 [Hevea brasiliensis]